MSLRVSLAQSQTDFWSSIVKEKPVSVHFDGSDQLVCLSGHRGARSTNPSTGSSGAGHQVSVYYRLIP